MKRAIITVTLWVMGSAFSAAETITIKSADTAGDLSKVVEESIAELAKNPGASHKLVFSGSFKLTSPVKIHWWEDHPLTISGPAFFDGSALSEESEIVFMAGLNITIEILSFTNSRGHALVVGGKSDQYTIRNCKFEDCQKGAIHVWNDPHTISDEITRRGMISGNRITRFNLEGAKWANDGITVFDQRVTISENVISDSATETNGIRAMGRDLIVERNVVRNVSTEDSGGIYLWGGPHASLFRGNVVRGNRIVGASRGIYLDDGTSGALVEENVIEDSAVCAIFLSGGRDNVVERNVVSGAPVFVHLDSRCLGWDSRPEYAGLARESAERLREALARVPDGAVIRKRYPVLSGFTKENQGDKLIGRPEANQVKGNFVREVEKIWELMDFSKDVKTDFHALNEFMPPEALGQAVELSNVSLSEKFGFRIWDRLQEVEAEQTLSAPKVK